MYNPPYNRRRINVARRRTYECSQAGWIRHTSRAVVALGVCDINTLEQFWATHKLEDIERAEKLFRGLLPEEHSKNLEYISNGLTFSTYIARMAQPRVTNEQKTKLKEELYQTVKPMYIFQGLTAAIVWIPEALRFFSARVDMMVEDYNSSFFAGAPRPEVVDRSIYPRATSKPFTFQWPKENGSK
jgi:hypothetical protein